MWSLIKRWLPFGEFARLGIMGMNQRNISYISPYNDRSLFPLVDDKLKTKRLALEHGVNTPQLLGVINSQYEVSQLADMLTGLPGFCMKPAKGSGGKGILVVSRSEDGGFCRSNGKPLPLGEIQRHASNILAGLFSLGGAPDVAVVEGLIQAHPLFRRFSYAGVPDIRIIVFRGFPVMAMTRLSSAVSRGKANLHQGAVGVGIDIGTGRAVRAVQRDKPIRRHPDTGQDLLELQVPQWETMLALACDCHDMSGLGYLGVDLVLDRDKGPLLLELNARPGLSIQVANGLGLLPRLRSLEGIARPMRMSRAERIGFARRHFTAYEPVGVPTEAVEEETPA